MPHYTLIKTNGKIINLKSEPSYEETLKLLKCKHLDEYGFGFNYNNIDHHEAVIVIDDFSLSNNKPLNKVVSDALNRSQYWRNIEAQKCNGDFKVCGDVLVITENKIKD